MMFLEGKPDFLIARIQQRSTSTSLANRRHRQHEVFIWKRFYIMSLVFLGSYFANQFSFSRLWGCFEESTIAFTRFPQFTIFFVKYLGSNVVQPLTYEFLDDLSMMIF